VAGADLFWTYKALLHNPTLAETWFQHLNAVRWGTGLSGRLREILIGLGIELEQD
jgi:hypothetical protein